MASALYDPFKEALLNKEHDLNTDVINVTLVNTGTDYTFSAAHSAFASVTDYLAVTPQAIATPTITNGVFDSAGTPTFTSVAIDGAKTVDALVIYNDTTASDLLIAYIDGFTAVTPNGGDITVTWGANIFSL